VVERKDLSKLEDVKAEDPARSDAKIVSFIVRNSKENQSTTELLLFRVEIVRHSKDNVVPFLLK